MNDAIGLGNGRPRGPSQFPGAFSTGKPRRLQVLLPDLGGLRGQRGRSATGRKDLKIECAAQVRAGGLEFGCRMSSLSSLGWVARCWVPPERATARKKLRGEWYLSFAGNRTLRPGTALLSRPRAASKPHPLQKHLKIGIHEAIDPVVPALWPSRRPAMPELRAVR